MRGPGQYVTSDFPVLSAGPTPHTPPALWDFSVVGELDEPLGWTWDEFRALPSEEITVDIHCVTKWSKLDTVWTGVSVDTLLAGVETAAEYALVFSDGGYTTNLPLADLTGGSAWIVYRYEGEPLAPEHGGPARLLVPHLYLWKSAKWVRGLQLLTEDKPGFWEGYAYHDHGDPWTEQRYRVEPTDTHTTGVDASAGSLVDVFGDGLTGATATCATCATTSPLAGLAVFPDAPGRVARCPGCDAVLIVLVTRGATTCVDLAGLSALEPMREVR